MSYFSLVRMSLFIILVTVCIFIINKKAQPHRRVQAIIVSVFCCSVLSLTMLELIPFENMFLSFETPEEAYAYYSNNEVDLMIEGEDTCLILAKGNSKKLQIFKKRESGWKIRTGFKINITMPKTVGLTVVSVLSIDESDDKYIKINNAVDSQLEISDNRNSVFLQGSDKSYYAYVDDFSENYSININGKTVSF